MAKPAKPKVKDVVEKPKAVRVPAKRVRCYCGNQYLKGSSCRQDHAALAKATGQHLMATSPTLRMGYDKAPEAYIGPPWTMKKLRKFLKAYSNPMNANILDRKVECPHCRTATTWGQLEYGGCLSKGCVGAMPE